MNLASWPVISCRRLSTAWDFSRLAVRLTSGMCSATCWSKWTSRFGDDRERREDHDHAERALQQRPATGAAHAVEQRRPPSVKRQQHEPGAERVGERDRHRAPAGGADRDHGREDRAGAGRVDEPERGADEQARAEAVPGRARTERGQAREPRLQPIADRRHEQHDARGEQHDHGDVAQRVRAEPDAADDLGDPDDRDGERDRSARARRRAAAAGPPTPPAESSAGSTGSTHGDRAVPAPARMAKRIRISMGGEKKLVRLLNVHDAERMSDLP